jgi:hypothetical protein
MLYAARARFLSALQYRDYRYLWTASVFAGAAAWALIVARGWLAFQMTESSSWVGIVTFMALANLINGVLSDVLGGSMVMAYSGLLLVVAAAVISLAAAPLRGIYFARAGAPAPVAQGTHG